MTEPRTVRFTERLKGWLSFDETDYNQALLHGRREGTRGQLKLNIEITDLECFLDHHPHEARAHGYVECDELGGRLEVQDGRFELWATEPDERHLRMRYSLSLRDPAGRPLTLHGFKLVEDDPNFDSWRDVSTLFFRLYAGDVEAGKEPTDGPLATGILRLTPLALARQLTSNRGSIGSVLTFMWFFLREFARAYRGRPLTDSRPSFPRDRRRPLPAAARWQAVDGKPGLRRRIVPYVAGDNFKLNLHHVKGLKEPYRGPVMLSPGACLRAEVFYGQPSGRTIVDVLLDKGYDVWVQNWRGGIDLPPNPYSLDQVALYDHPAAVATVLRETRAKTLKAIVHCQGSVSFTMAAVAGLTPDVTHVVSSAVSLHVCVTPATKIKQRVMLPAVRAITPYADAQWGIRPASPPAGLLSGLARVVRRECDNPVCSTASYMFGTGPDVLLRHENVDDDVHRWLGSEVGFAPIRLMHQLARAARVGHLVRMEDLPPLPADYVAQPPVGRTPIFTFVVGKENRMFLPDGQRATFQYFDRHQPDRHDIQEFAGFGHLDLFVGKNPPFEAMVGGLER